MGKNQDYKNRALASLEGKWSKGIIATLIVLLIVGGVSNLVTLPFAGSQAAGASISSIWTLLCLPLEWGAAVYFLNLIRQEDLSYGRLFDGYKDFVRIFCTIFLESIIVAIGIVLLIIPGIILAIMFAQVCFIMKDDKDIKYMDALKCSAQMMKGHKMEYFWLELSFIGWIILSILTFGFGFLFLLPYMYTALAHYYEDLKAEVA